MEMESSRRPFSRSNEPGLKKARLTEDQGGGAAVNGRAGFAQQRQGNNPVLSRYRVSDRDAAAESNDPRGGGGAYVPQPVQHQELVSQYRTALAELTFNSKPIITNLTIIAGESLNAAKAITATICNNIIEVPSEQKLPSLYLLDSIVKNIGRDYIKYFAAKLPEVFCKAYRQVDAPIHQSMRHLFGTWKGVFPIQTLQMIEKELGFTSTANGASSGVSTSRSDTQSQRPAHSIHVNPKFMERQRLQHPIRTKGMASDLVNSLEDAERSDRVPSISAGRPWVDPHVKMPSVQRLNRDTLSERFHEKNVDGEYVEYDYDSDPRSSSLGVGRPGAKVTNDKPWYGGGSSVAESVSSQRNGFNIKRGLTPQLAPKSANTDPRLRTTQGIATRTSGALSTSWKNSEEEEFMWDDMNSRVTDHRNPEFSSNSGKERWVSDDPDNLDFASGSRKLKGVNDYASTVDLEMADPVERKDLSALGQRMSSPLSFQESHVVDRLTPSSTPVASSVHLERYTSSLSGLSTSGDSSVARMGSRPQTVSSGVGDSGFGLPTNATSGSTGAAGKQKQQILGKSDLGLHNRSYEDSRLYEDSIPASVYNGRLGGTVKSQPQALKGLSPALATVQSRSHYPSRQQPDSAEPESLDQTRLPHISKASSFVIPSTVGSSLPVLSNLLAAENSGQSSTSSLLHAVLKTGILSNFGDKEKLPSQSGVQPPLPSGRPTTKIPLPGSKVAPAPSSGHPSRDNSPAPSGVPQKVGHPPLPPGQPPSLSQEDDASPSLVKTASDPISNLLSSLVAKGLISASNSDAPSLSSSQKPTEVQKQSLFPTTTSSVTVSPISVSPIVPPVVPVSSQSDDVSLSESISLTSILPRSTKTEIKNLIGCEFKPDKLRELHPYVINELFDDLPHKCDICGLRLKVKERLDRHLEWHALKNPRADGSLKVSRGWYANSINWVTGHAGEPLEIDSNDLRDNGRTVVHTEPMVSADESQCVCVICGNTFEDFYCQESDDWMFKGAIYMTIPCGDGESGVTGASVVKGPIVHASCIDENSLDDLGLAPCRIKLEKDV